MDKSILFLKIVEAFVDHELELLKVKRSNKESTFQVDFAIFSQNLLKKKISKIYEESLGGK